MKTQCPHCKTIVNAPTDSVGRKAKCPKCERAFRIEPVQTDESLNDAELRQSPPAKGNHAVEDSSVPVSRNESSGKQNSNTCPNCGQKQRRSMMIEDARRFYCEVLYR